MNNKQYPTRMHEVLGVETGERFEIPNHAGEVHVDNYGYLCSVFENDVVCGARVCEAINHPERITRRPRLTEEQVERLKAWLVVGFRWMAKDKEGGDTCIYVSKPKKYEEAEIWGEGGKFGYVIGPEKELVSWSDPEPLDIVATLKVNGVEVE